MDFLSKGCAYSVCAQQQSDPTPGFVESATRGKTMAEKVRFGIKQ